MDDTQFVRAFRSDAEWAGRLGRPTLIGDHLPWVYALCLRATRHRTLAAQAAQAVFILLTHQSTSGRCASGFDHDSDEWAAWLFKTARFASSAALKVCRRGHGVLDERTFDVDDHLDPPGRALWARIAPLLDEAVACLYPADQRAILANFYHPSSATTDQRPHSPAADLAHALESLGLNLQRQGRGEQGQRIQVPAVRLAGLMLARVVLAPPSILSLHVAAMMAGEAAPAIAAQAIAAAAANAMTSAAHRLLAAITAQAA